MIFLLHFLKILLSFFNCTLLIQLTTFFISGMASGRPRHSGWLGNNFQFMIDPETKRAAAYCTNCQKIVKNTAAKRLDAHRNICRVRSDGIGNKSPEPQSDAVEVRDAETPSHPPAKNPRYSVQLQGLISEDEDEPDQVNDSISLPMPVLPAFEFDGNESEFSRPSTSFSAQSDSDMSLQFGSPLSPTGSISNRGEGSRSTSPDSAPMNRYADKMTAKESAVNSSNLAKFIFGCNIPLSVVESSHFKAFVKGIRPSYNIPTRKTLSSTLLDQTYEDCLNTTKFGPKSVLLIDGWKNESANTKNVAAMLHNATGGVGFLDAWDISGESETGDKLSELVAMAITRARDVHNTELYAVVSDNAANMVKMGRLVDLWHVTCSSHSGNLLAKSLVSDVLASRVNMVLKGFSGPDIESKLLFHKGHRIILGGDTRWCSYRDAFQCFLTNVPAMKLVLADPSVGSKVSKNVTTLIFDANFIKQVQDGVELFNPVCKLINVCQSTHASLADATEAWLGLELPPGYNNQKKLVDDRKSKALSTYGLVANYLHPSFRGAKLSPEQLDDVDDFLFSELDVEGFKDLHAFKTNAGIFGILKNKQEQQKSTMSSAVFWGMAFRKHPSLATLAEKLNNIPASSAQLERIFSNWSYVHNRIRNRLTFDRSKKLLHVYHALKLKDSATSDEY